MYRASKYYANAVSFIVLRTILRYSVMDNLTGGDTVIRVNFVQYFVIKPHHSDEKL